MSTAAKDGEPATIIMCFMFDGKPEGSSSSNEGFPQPRQTHVTLSRSHRERGRCLEACEASVCGTHTHREQVRAPPEHAAVDRDRYARIRRALLVHRDVVYPQIGDVLAYRACGRIDRAVVRRERVEVVDLTRHLFATRSTTVHSGAVI